MSDEGGCLFDEPFRGTCGKPCVLTPDDCTNEDIFRGMCCKDHQEMCSVCGDKAFTRCMASIGGCMCGEPLCELCGEGEMCLSHSSKGPVKKIRELLKIIREMRGE